MENNKEQFIWKGTEFWTKEIEKAGIKNQLRFFNDVIVEKKAPHPDSGYGNPIMIDVILDEKKFDIYHSDQKKGDTTHRLYLHTKE